MRRAKRLIRPFRLFTHFAPKKSWVSLKTHRKIKLFVIVFFLMSFVPLFLYVRWALGATAVWTNGGGDGLWSNCANWSGGTGTGGCPGTNDVATFNTTSTANAAIDTNISVKGILISSGYTGTITQNTTRTITIGSSGYSQADGTFTGGDSAITLNDPSGSFSLTNGTFSNTSATMSIVKNMTISGGTFNNSGIVQFNSTTAGGSQTLTCNGTIPGSVDIAQTVWSNLTFALSSGCSITLITNVSTIGSITNNGTINATNINMTGSNFTQNGTLNMSGTLKFNSTAAAVFQTLTCSGNLTSSGGVVDVAQTWGNGTFTLSAGCTATMATNVTQDGHIINNGTMNATNINLSRDFTQGGTLNITGTLNLNSSAASPSQTLYCTGNLTSSGGLVNIAQTYGNGTFTLGSGCIVTLVANVSQSGSIVNNGTMNATNINLSRNFTQSGTLNITGTLNFNSSQPAESQTLTCSGDLTSSGGLVNIAQTYGNGTFTLGSGCKAVLVASVNQDGNITNNGTMYATNISLTRGFTQNGTFIISGSLTFSNLSIGEVGTITCTQPIQGNVVINKTTFSSDYGILGSDCTVTGNFTRTAGQFKNPTSPYTLTVKGNFSMSTTDLFGGSNLTLAFGGSDNQTITQNAGSINNNIQINKSGGIASLSTNLTTNGTATVSAGTYFLNGKTFSASQGFTVQNGGNLQMIGTETPTTPTLDSGSTVTLVGDGDSLADSYTAPSWTYSNFTVNTTDSNDTVNPPVSPFTIGGSFTESGGIFSAPAVFNVAGNFSHTGGTFTTNNGLVNLNGTNQKLYGDTTFYDLTKSASNDTLTFESGKTQTVTHTATLTGTSGAPLRLFATSPGTQAKFDPQGTRTFSYLNVKDNNNTNATIISTSGLNINNVGDNTNWDFSGRPTANFHVLGTHFGSGSHITTH